MSFAIALRDPFRRLLALFEHVAAVVIGLVLMIVGLALGVTMIMLPVGLTVGLIGVAILVAGLFAHIDP